MPVAKGITDTKYLNLDIYYHVHISHTSVGMNAHSFGCDKYQPFGVS